MALRQIEIIIPEENKHALEQIRGDESVEHIWDETSGNGSLEHISRFLIYLFYI